MAGKPWPWSILSNLGKLFFFLYSNIKIGKNDGFRPYLNQKTSPDDHPDWFLKAVVLFFQKSLKGHCRNQFVAL